MNNKLVFVRTFCHNDLKFIYEFSLWIIPHKNMQQVKITLYEKNLNIGDVDEYKGFFFLV